MASDTATVPAPARSGRGGWERLQARVPSLTPDAWAMMTIAAFVLAANLPYLLDFFDPNPLGPRSGLMASLYPGVLGGQPTIDPNNGFISQAISHLATHDLIHLHLPWWNPYEGTGMPLAGQMQSAAFFPPTWLTLLSNGQLYEHILLELIAGISTYLLLRRVAVSRWAATAAGVAFGLNGTFAWFAHAPVNPVAFLPLLLLGIELAYERTLAARHGGWWLIALAGALSFLAGFPEVTYIDTLTAICWFGWRLGCLPRQRMPTLAIKAGLGALVAAMLCAPLLIAMADYFPHADLGLHDSSQLGSAHFSTNALPQVIMPYVYGPIFGYNDARSSLLELWSTVGGYITASLLLLALFGLFSRGRRGLRLTLLVWVVLVFARMYGLPYVLSGVIGVLPDMARVAFFRYATASLELSLIIFAALGIDDLRRSAQRRRIALLAGAVLVLVGLGALEARTITDHLPGKFAHRPYYAGSIAWAALSVLGIGAAAWLLRPRLRVPAIALVLAVDAAAMFAIPEFSAPRSVQVDQAPVTFLQRHLGSGRFFTLGPFQPNYGSYFELASLNVNDFPPKAMTDYVHRRLDSVVDPTVFVGNYGGGRPLFAASPQQELMRNLDAYRQAGVAYVLTPPGQALPQRSGAFTLVFRSPSTWIYRLAGSRPFFTASDPRCRVSFADRDSAKVNCPAPARLIRSETELPGWSATVDGRGVTVGSADGPFQSVRVAAGQHRVNFSFAPRGVVWGYVAFGLGLLALLGGGGRVLGRGRGRRAELH